MKRIAALCLAVALAVGGCPGQTDIPSAVTILAAGTYVGNWTCTRTISTSAGDTTSQEQGTTRVMVTDLGQLYIDTIPYFEGIVLDLSTKEGEVHQVTIGAITENAATGTVVVPGSGTWSTSTRSYVTQRTITIVQPDDTQLDVTDLYTGQDIAAGASFGISCTGNLAR